MVNSSRPSLLGREARCPGAASRDARAAQMHFQSVAAWVIMRQVLAASAPHRTAAKQHGTVLLR